LGFLCSSSICMKGSSSFRLFSIHNSTVPQWNSHFCPLAESRLGEHDITEMSGLLRNILLGREVVFLNSKSGHNPESRMAAIWGESQRVYANRGGGLTNWFSFCETRGLRKENSPSGRGAGASGTNSSKNSFTGIGPTNLLHMSNVMSR